MAERSADQSVRGGVTQGNRHRQCQINDRYLSVDTLPHQERHAAQRSQHADYLPGRWNNSQHGNRDGDRNQRRKTDGHPDKGAAVARDEVRLQRKWPGETANHDKRERRQITAAQCTTAGRAPPDNRQHGRPTNEPPSPDRRRWKPDRPLLHQHETGPPDEADEDEPDVGHRFLRGENEFGYGKRSGEQKHDGTACRTTSSHSFRLLARATLSSPAACSASKDAHSAYQIAATRFILSAGSPSINACPWVALRNASAPLSSRMFRNSRSSANG